MNLYEREDVGKVEDCSVILNPDVPTAAHNGMSYRSSRAAPGSYSSLMLLLGPGAPSVASNDATYPDVLLDMEPLSSAIPPAPRNAVAYSDWLTARLNLSSGTPHRVAHNGAPCSAPDGLMEPLCSDAAPTTWNAVVCPDELMAHLSSDASSAARNTVAYPGVATARDMNALSHVTQGVEAVELLRPTGTAAAETEQGGGDYYYSSGMALPFAAQVVDEAGRDSDSLIADSAVAQDEDEVAGAVAEPVPVRGGLGPAAITLAVAGLTGGGAGTPSTAIALFAMLIAGVTLVTIRVFRA